MPATPPHSAAPDLLAEKAQHARRIAWMPWTARPADIDAPAHRARCDLLARQAGALINPAAFVAEGAVVLTDRLVLGARSWIAAQALLRGDLVLGADCSVNPYACLSGTVVMGNDVRIASHATLVGFDHGMADLDLPIRSQPLIRRGITIGNDVWIGANAVILDGARIGDGAVIAAGAVVRGTIPPRTIAGGVPARVLRHRGPDAAPHTTAQGTATQGTATQGTATQGTAAQQTSPAAPPTVTPRTDDPDHALARLNRAIRDEWPEVLAACRMGVGYLSADASGTPRPALRHICDAIEIAAAMDGLDALEGRDALAAQLRSAQDPLTGLFPDPQRPPDPARPLRDDPIALYNVLAISEALACLGQTPAHPVHAVEVPAADLCDWLDRLPWRTNAWGAGATVDAIATGLHLNARHAAPSRNPEVLTGWLALNVDAGSGLWGRPTPEQGLLLPVNGFYRVTRGSYARAGLPVPHPQAAITSVLSNYRAHGGFAQTGQTACNLLDTIHPLWLCLRQTDHRRAEAQAIARDLIGRVAALWQPGLGIPFAPGHPPGLQGTEMWLSVAHTACALLGCAGDFAFQPRGVHRLRPAADMAGSG